MLCHNTVGGEGEQVKGEVVGQTIPVATTLSPSQLHLNLSVGVGGTYTLAPGTDAEGRMAWGWWWIGSHGDTEALEAHP